MFEKGQNQGHLIVFFILLLFFGIERDDLGIKGILGNFQGGRRNGFRIKGFRLGYFLRAQPLHQSSHHGLPLVSGPRPIHLG